MTRSERRKSMSTLKFILVTCFVFIGIGPLIPLPAIAIGKLITTGDLSYLNPWYLFMSFFGYIFGSVIALQTGISVAILNVLLIRFLPSFLPNKTVWGQTVFGATTGLIVYVAFRAPEFIKALAEARVEAPFNELSSALYSAVRLATGNTFSFFLLPTVICGAIVGWQLVPKLIAHYR
jgi:hypothetical protein